MHSIKSYSHSAREAAFLLSGTGKVSAAARGESRDREILNRPGAGNYLPFPFSALRASGHHVPSVTWVPESEPAGDCGELDALKSPADPGPARVPATAPPGRRKRELDGPAELSVFDLSIPKLLVLALINACRLRAARTAEDRLPGRTGPPRPAQDRRQHEKRPAGRAGTRVRLRDRGPEPQAVREQASRQPQRRPGPEGRRVSPGSRQARANETLLAPRERPPCDSDAT